MTSSRDQSLIHHQQPSDSDPSSLPEQQEQLRESEVRKRAMLEAALDCIITIDHEGYILEFNPAAERTFGYAREHAIGSLMADLIMPPEYKNACLSSLGLHLHTGESTVLGSRLERPAMRADGTIIQTEMAIIRIDLPDREFPLFTAYLRDISDQKEHERQIEFHKHMLNAVGQTIVTTDMNRVITYWSKGAEQALGWTADEVVGRPIAEIAPAAHLKDEAGKLHKAVREGDTWVGEFPIRRKDGSTFPAVVSLAPVSLADQGIVGVIGVYTDVSELKQTEEELRIHKHMLDAVGQAVFATDEHLRITYINRAAEELYGYEAAEVMGRNFLDFVPPESEGMLHAKRGLEMVSQHGSSMGEMTTYNKNGDVIPALVSASLVHDEAGEQAGLVIALADMTRRKELENQLAHQAYHDALTSLPNRHFFQKRLAQRIESAQKHNDQFAVLFFDLDNFKVINDSLGHSAGDQLLNNVARRVQTCIRDGDLLARLGGDEFTILRNHVTDDQDASILAERIASMLEEPFAVYDHEVFVATSIGIALGDASTTSSDEILRNADLAMYEAKNTGKNRYAIFEPGMPSRARLRLTLETEIHKDITRNR